MGAGHGHSHGASGDSPPSDRRIRKMVIALAILTAFFLLEVIVGFTINSLGLMADAGHMFTDVLGMSMGLIALLLAKKGSKAAARTFGWHRAEVLTAIVNALLLLVVAGWIMFEAISRIGEAPQIPGLALILTAAAGLIANLAVLLLIRGDADGSLAVRGAYMEVLADAVGSLGVLIAGVLLVVFDWTWADIVVGIAISLWVIPRAVSLAGASLRILTQASPSGVDVTALTADLEALPDVVGVHDLHVWTLTTGMDVATVHLESNGPGGVLLERARAVLGSYGLDHATVQVDPCEQGTTCKDELTW